MQKDALTELANCLGAGFAAALSGMLGEDCTAEVAAPAADGDSTGGLHWVQPFGPEAEAALTVSYAESVWRAAGGAALQAVGVGDPEEPDIRATFLELLSQAISGVARLLSQRTGRDIAAGTGREEQAKGRGESAAIVVRGKGGLEVPLRVMAADRLLQMLAPDTAAGNTADCAPALAAAPGRLDMLMDVELPVSVSFGRTQLALKDVIKLNTGSIVELNRSITEPVEVIINNCVVARGEVVVIEGNYGVRIQQIVSRADRLRSVD